MAGSDADGDDDFVWDDEKSDALSRALMEAKLVASADSMRAFLKQADNEVRLSATEEVELARRIEAGRRASQVLAEFAERDEVLPDAHLDELKQLRRDGDDARDELLKANLRLVVSVAKRYTGRGTAFLDLVAGRRPGSDVCGREVRRHKGLQVLHVRHVVDSAGGLAPKLNFCRPLPELSLHNLSLDTRYRRAGVLVRGSCGAGLTAVTAPAPH